MTRANTILDIDRFFKIDDGCWLCFGPRKIDKYGLAYGQLKINGKMYSAHRLMYQYFYKIDPGKLDVLHTCDVKNCVRPNHLFLGTHSDNMKDMVAKGRRNIKGERGSAAKITDVQALQIRNDSRSASIIAAKYKISKPAVLKVKSRKTFRHLP